MIRTAQPRKLPPGRGHHPSPTFSPPHKAYGIFAEKTVCQPCAVLARVVLITVTSDGGHSMSAVGSFFLKELKQFLL